MKPIAFPESNKELLPPKGDDGNCSNLPIYNDGTYCISCWKPSFKERVKLIFGGNVWAWVRSGHTQPPIAITAHYPFQKSKS